MFKRVEKRRLKKEEEEELGIDDDMKEILGMHDTDSEESGSDSDDSEDEQEDEENDGEGSELEMEGDDEQDVEDEVDGEDDDGDEDGDEGESQDEAADEEEEEEDPNVSVKQALEDPVYVVSVQPEVKACIICPGKVLKGVKMVQLHRASNAHDRRVKQFKEFAVDADPSESAWEVLQRNSEQKPKLSLAPTKPGQQSKRAEKKKAHAERQKQRREKQKLKRIEEAKKKKEGSTAAAGSSTEVAAGDASKPVTSKPKKSKGDKKDKGSKPPTSTTSPPKKKRKVDAIAEAEISTPSVKRGKGRPRVAPEDQPSATGEQPKSAPPKGTTDNKSPASVKSIVRSTSDRAKNARARAMISSKGGKDATKPRKRVSMS